ncbi:hypothetical protein LINPERHAP2_LOCUS32026 [Linum perenne]
MVLLNIRRGKVVPRIRVSQSSTIHEVKKAIKFHIRISTSRQNLAYRGQDLDDDDETLESYGITDAKSPVNLSLKVKKSDSKFKITVTGIHGEQKKMTVLESLTVGMLKKDISDKFNVQASRLQLSCHGKKMVDKVKLRKYYVVEDTTIHAFEGSKYTDDIEDDEDSTDWEEEERKKAEAEAEERRKAEEEEADDDEDEEEDEEEQ